MLRVLAEGERARAKPAEFAADLLENSALAATLEEMIAAGSTPGAALSAQFKLVDQSCKDCHVKFRD
jgi:cytochrome c556